MHGDTSKCALSCVTTKSCDDNTEPLVPAVLPDSNSHRALGSVLLVGRTQHVVRWASLSGQYSPTVLRQLMDGWRRVLLPVHSVLLTWKEKLDSTWQRSLPTNGDFMPPHTGDEILEVNGESLQGLTHQQAIQIFKVGFQRLYFINNVKNVKLELLSPPDGGESNYTNATDVCIQLLTLCCNLLELLQFL